VGFFDFDVTDDPELLQRQALARFAALKPGFVPHDGSPLTALLAVIAQLSSDLAELVREDKRESFRSFGRSVQGLQQIDAVAATTTSTWTLRDTGGHLIPAGTLLAYRPPGAAPVALRVVNDVTVLPGQGTANGVLLSADPGAAGNGVPAGPVDVLDALSFVQSVATVAATSGGLDAESADGYVGRLADFLTVPTRTPVRSPHFALLAREVPGVFRALAIANFDADNGTDNVPACTTVYPLDAFGQPVPAAVRTALAAYLAALRETSYLVRVGTPTYTAVALTYAAVAEVGALPLAVKAAVDLRASQLLDPARFAGGDETPPTWRPMGTIPIGWVQQQLGSVPGVAYLSNVTLNGAAADLVLPGRAPLPKAPGAGGSSVAGMVTSP
jgi:hypothetical protein